MGNQKRFSVSVRTTEHVRDNNKDLFGETGPLTRCPSTGKDQKLTAGLLAYPGRELGSLILRWLAPRWHWTYRILASASAEKRSATLVVGVGKGDEVGLPTPTWYYLGTLHI